MTQVATALDPLTEGWFNHGDRILALVEQHRPTVCVELGTWLGASAIPVARAIRRWRGTLTCVDTWGAEVLETNQTPWMLTTCARHLVQAGVSATVRLIPATTADAARWWTAPIDYLYIDADHTYEGVAADLRAWVPHVRPGGLVLGDDYGSTIYPGVRAAWDDFAQAAHLTLEVYQSDPPNPHGIALVSTTV